MSTMTSKTNQPNLSPSAPGPAASGPGPHAVGGAGTKITPDCIRQRAYEIYLRRNGGPGDEASDWAQAEKELCGARDEPPPEACDPMVIEIRTRSVRPTHARG